MSNVNEWIAKAEALLEGIEPPPWAVGGEWGTEIVSPTGYVVANEVCLGDREFIAAAPDLVRELVDALNRLRMPFGGDDEVHDVDAMTGILKEHTKERIGVTFLNGDTYVMYAGEILSAFIKAQLHDDAWRD